MGEKIYLAGPVHHSQDHGMGWRSRIKKERDDFEWVDPTDAYDPTKTYGEIVHDWSNEDIVEKDLELLRDCDGLLVHWEDVKSVGTPMEIVYAKERHNIPVVVQTTVDDLPIWLDVHADAVVDTFDEAIDELDDRMVRGAGARSRAIFEAFGH